MYYCDLFYFCGTFCLGLIFVFIVFFVLQKIQDLGKYIVLRLLEIVEFQVDLGIYGFGKLKVFKVIMGQYFLGFCLVNLNNKIYYIEGCILEGNFILGL